MYLREIIENNGKSTLINVKYIVKIVDADTHALVNAENGGVKNKTTKRMHIQFLNGSSDYFYMSRTELINALKNGNKHEL